MCGRNLTLVSQYIIVLSLLTCDNFSETAEVDSHEALEIDNKGYPQLPENILELRH
jgi:hypothetical protein